MKAVAAAFVNRVDDWLNPIVVKELRQAVKSRIVMFVLMLFLLLMLVILMAELLLDNPRDVNALNLTLGRQVFLILQAVLLGTCMVLVPTYAGIRLAAEHSETNVDLLFISTLRPRGIIAGKLQAGIILMLLIFSACAPFMTFTYLLRGIELPSIFIVLALDFLVVLLATQAAIFLGAIPGNAGMRLMLGLLGLGMLITFFVSAVRASSTMLELGLGSRMDSVEFWLLAGSWSVAVLIVIGLLFTWSMAVVSPPSSNRALPVRLYTLGAWLITGCLAGYLARYFRMPYPLHLWMGIFTLLLCGYVVVAINEREQWGHRVRRTIPKWRLLRVPLFPLYSGAASGLLYAVLLLAVTIALPGYFLFNWESYYPSTFGRRMEQFNRETTNVFLLIALYVFDYCTIALLLRNTLLHRWVPPTNTWVLALMLCGLGFALPYPFLFLFLGDEYHMGHVNPWMQISNPFATIYTCVGQTESLNLLPFWIECLTFLVAWGTAMILLNLSWMLRQWKRFSPPEPATPATPQQAQG